MNYVILKTTLILMGIALVLLSIQGLIVVIKLIRLEREVKKLLKPKV